LTLLEVLVSIAVFSLGVTAVIALFPVGVSRMRQAVLDTRCTLMAQQAYHVLRLQELPSRLGNRFLDNSTLTTPIPDNIYGCLRLDSMSATLPARLAGWNNNDATQELPTTFLNPQLKSFPVLIDPMYFEEQKVNGATLGYNQASIPIFNYYSTYIGGTPPYLDVPIVTTQRVWNLPAASVKPYLYRWFADSGGVQFDPRNPVVPLNAYRGTALTQDYLVAGTSQTAQRDYDYSWALMLQQNIDFDVSTPLVVGQPAGWNSTDLKVLCFYRRNLSVPVKVIEGCFFENSRKVTLSWPIAAPTPTIKRGTWLCEASITGGKVSGTYTSAPAGQRQYRQSFNFYRVAAVEPIQSASGRNYQVVDIEGFPQGYEGRESTLGDSRSLPDLYAAPTWPLSNPVAIDTVMYYPVAIFDGLEWVY
jgi:type II secretory pathway pseudopilin PulG